MRFERASGTFYLDSAGLVGVLAVSNPTLHVTGFELSAEQYRVEVNTRRVEVTEEFLLDVDGVTLLPGGCPWDDSHVLWVTGGLG